MYANLLRQGRAGRKPNPSSISEHLKVPLSEPFAKARPGPQEIFPLPLRYMLPLEKFRVWPKFASAYSDMLQAEGVSISDSRMFNCYYRRSN